MNTRLLPVRRVLLSVSDKSGLLEIANELTHWGAELISTGGTKNTLQAAGLKTLDISEVTGFPEMLDGRVKTLHPKIHGGILAIRDNPDHLKKIQQHEIQPIDMVICNLYPFAKVAANPQSSFEEIVENIDIGGPSMVRSAAKNHNDVAVITDPSQYPGLIQELRATNGKTSLETRKAMARDAFTHTARYDHAISQYFHSLGGCPFPEKLGLHFDQKLQLRYGENPHQQAAFYSDPSPAADSLARAAILHGKELSYNNILDLDSALNLVREFTQPACVILKHNNPCGAAIATQLDHAFKSAYEGDPLSAYGGIVACNREVDEPTAQTMSEPGRFIECILAPGFSQTALEILTTKPTWKKSVRLLAAGTISPALPGYEFRKVDGGWLVQDRDLIKEKACEAKVVSQLQPTEEQLSDLQFAWTVCKHVKSNAIVVAKHGKLLGTGAGQMSRVDAVQNALKKAGDKAQGAVLASDAFFPFRDGVDEAAKSGIKAIIQPGGSMRDTDAIAAANEHGMSMLFTGIRHFRH